MRELLFGLLVLIGTAYTSFCRADAGDPSPDSVARAEQLYNSVLGEQPSNTEALSGLGDVAKQRHDPVAAAKLYDKVVGHLSSF